MRFRRLQTVWLKCALLLAMVVAAAPAEAQTDRRWGVLGEVAEQDFTWGIGIVTWRWKVPNRVLTMTFWGLGGNRRTDYELNPATGEIEQRVFAERGSHFSTARGFRVEADGSLTLRSKSFLRRDSDGTLRHGDWKYKPIRPGDKAMASVAKIVASGRVRAADPSLRSLPSLAAGSSNLPENSPAVSTSVVQQPHVDPSKLAVQAGLGPRLALVIGNSAYSSWLGELPNPANDADAMAAALRSLGFTVTLVKNADQKAMKRAIAAFGEKLAGAGPNATGLFFYAGHGIQARGINYLIPTNAEIRSQADVDLEAVGADTVLQQMEEAGASTNIVILDACRNMPLVRGFRSPTRGLAPMDAPNGSFIAYSTAPGSVAADGVGSNSPFVTALIRNLGRPGQSIEGIFRDVRREVLTATAGAQTPWDSSSLIQPFYFAGQ